ncbi:unnamed protein product [Hymenolepis diminuta]|uniref:Uncharacterized protein n=1 Tax=Hymenolepis diminuta TaxID=6216 RepID=A0A564Y407_HYMDI|nr:unnamed protein product [Hymenolepis diminuta]
MATCNCSQFSYFEHPALGSSLLLLQAEVILFEINSWKPPSAVFSFTVSFP